MIEHSNDLRRNGVYVRYCVCARNNNFCLHYLGNGPA